VVRHYLVLNRDLCTDCARTVWLRDGNQLRCKLCLTNWLFLSHAREHDMSRGHINRVRVLDALPNPRASNVGPLESNDIPLDASASLDYDSNDIGTYEDVTPRALHGPALPDDPSSAIYDDFSGALAMEDGVADTCDSMDAEDAPALHWNEVFTAPSVHEEEFDVHSAPSSADEANNAGA
jgi:hypothetical protein